jgi:hypothetical protein
MGENMPDKEFLSDLRRAREEEYFHKKERALEEANRQRALREAKRGELGAVIGIFEEHLLNKLLVSGFTPETIRLLYLIPALEVAWIDGSVSDSEHARMLEFGREQGAEEGSPAYEQLLAWLKGKPTADFFESTLRLIGRVCGLQTATVGEATLRTVTCYCSQIAEASGGWLGLGSKISRPEAQIIDRIGKSIAGARFIGK